MGKIAFQEEDGSITEFYLEEQTTIGGITYFLVTDSMEDEADAYILKDVSAPDSEEACLEFVEDEEENQAVFSVFEQMLSDEYNLEK